MQDLKLTTFMNRWVAVRAQNENKDKNTELLGVESVSEEDGGLCYLQEGLSGVVTSDDVTCL